MTFQSTLSKIESSKIFQRLKQEHPEAELCAGFFILDFFGNDTKKSLDYKIGEKILTFTLQDNDDITFNEDKLINISNKPSLEKISPEIKVELDELKSIAGIRTLDEGIHSKFSKIIAVLQMHQGKQIWNLTCMLEGLIILNILIDANTGEIIKFERKSMMDLIKKK